MELVVLPTPPFWFAIAVILPILFHHVFLNDLAVQTSGLSVHIFYNNIIDFSERSTILQNLPGLIGMKMNLDQLFISYCQQAITFEMFCNVVINFIFIQIGTFN